MSLKCLIQLKVFAPFRRVSCLVTPVAPGAGGELRAVPYLKRGVPPDEKERAAAGPPVRLAPDARAGTEDQKLRWN